MTIELSEAEARLIIDLIRNARAQLRSHKSATPEEINARMNGLFDIEGKIESVCTGE